MARTAAPKNPAATGVVSLKVTLRNIKPPIWRRLLLSDKTTLDDVHLAIQVAMGWSDSHLHSFDIDGQQYGDPSAMEDLKNERRQTLASLMKSGITKFRYTYDFGDDWEHDILIEPTVPVPPATGVPACVAGKRHCPPDDCGGPWGYADLLLILADSAHPQHREQREWIGDGFDPEEFSVKEANDALGAAWGRA